MSRRPPHTTFELTARLALAALAVALAGPAVAPPPRPEIPLPVRGLLYARPFALEKPFHYDWSAEHPEVREGLMLVLQFRLSARHRSRRGHRRSALGPGRESVTGLRRPYEVIREVGQVKTSRTSLNAYQRSQ